MHIKIIVCIRQLFSLINYNVEVYKGSKIFGQYCFFKVGFAIELALVRRYVSMTPLWCSATIEQIIRKKSAKQSLPIINGISPANGNQLNVHQRRHLGFLKNSPSFTFSIPLCDSTIFLIFKTLAPQPASLTLWTVVSDISESVIFDWMNITGLLLIHY